MGLMQLISKRMLQVLMLRHEHLLLLWRQSGMLLGLSATVSVHLWPSWHTRSTHAGLHVTSARRLLLLLVLLLLRRLLRLLLLVLLTRLTRLALVLRRTDLAGLRLTWRALLRWSNRPPPFLWPALQVWCARRRGSHAGRSNLSWLPWLRGIALHLPVQSLLLLHPVLHALVHANARSRGRAWPNASWWGPARGDALDQRISHGRVHVL